MAPAPAVKRAGCHVCLARARFSEFGSCSSLSFSAQPTSTCDFDSVRRNKEVCKWLVRFCVTVEVQIRRCASRERGFPNGTRTNFGTRQVLHMGRTFTLRSYKVCRRKKHYKLQSKLFGDSLGYLVQKRSKAKPSRHAPSRRRITDVSFLPLKHHSRSIFTSPPIAAALAPIVLQLLLCVH